MKHELVDNTLYVEKDGVVGRCSCGFTTGYRFSSFVASAAFQEHLDEMENTEVKRG